MRTRPPMIWTTTGPRVHVLSVRAEADRVVPEVVRVPERDLDLRERLADPLPVPARRALEHARTTQAAV